MKFRTGILSCTALIVVAGSASAAPRNYLGSDTLEKFTETLVTECGALGTYPALAGANPDFNYTGGGSTGGGNSLKAGSQDIAPMSRALNQSEFCDADLPAGPQGENAQSLVGAEGDRSENWAVARDGLSVLTSAANALRCDNGTVGGVTGITDTDGIEGTADDFGAPMAFNTVIARPIAGNYTFQNWRDVLRVLWAGSPVAEGTAQNAINRETRCNSELRRTLVANWDRMIQGNQSCGVVANSCANATTGVGLPLRHILRRDDLSGTTDTFLSLLGLNSVGGTLAAGTLGVNEPFCNGRDTEDRDPIRIRCTNVNPAAGLNDETCAADQTTGLVMAIRVPTFIGTNNTLTANGNRQEPLLQDLYPSQPGAPVNCQTGVFAVRPPPAIYGAPPFAGCVPPIGVPGSACCPDGSPFFGTGCLTPVAAPGTLLTYTDAAGGTVGTPIDADCNCVNSFANNNGLGPDLNTTIAGPQNDGRIWNRYLRGPRAPFRNTPNPCPALRDERGVQVLLADARLRYRTHTVNLTAVPSTPAANPLLENDKVCHEFDATRNIGCLSRASDCTVGFAGREAVIDEPDVAGVQDPGTDYNGAQALLLGPGISATDGLAHGPDKASIYASTASSGYQLARKLYFNSIAGFAASLPTGTNIPSQGLVGTGTRVPDCTGGVGGPTDAACAAAGETTSLETAQLIQCLLVESGPINTALAASGFLPVVTETNATPFEDLSVVPVSEGGEGTAPGSNFTCP